MYNVLIVEDDLISRTAVKTMINWNKIGFQIIGEVDNGKKALEIIHSELVHVIITDMKMPIMDGLELIEKVRKENNLVTIIALSSFNEFELVRKAFKLGIEDYILKSELSPKYLETYIKTIKNKIETKMKEVVFKETIPKVKKDLFKEYILGKEEPTRDQFKQYYIIMIQIADINNIRKRFPNLNEELILPMIEVIKQIPRVSKECQLTQYSETRIVLCYHVNKESFDKLISLCNQIIRVLKNYMNLSVTIGTSHLGKGAGEFYKTIDSANINLSLQYIYGESRIFTYKDEEKFKIREILQGKEKFDSLLKSFRLMNDDMLIKAESDLFCNLEEDNLEYLKKLCLYMIYLEAIMLEENGDSIFNIFGRSICFEEKINRLISSKDVMMWAYNFNRWILDYIKKRYENNSRSTPFEVVKKYIDDNYADNKLTLKEVASLVGLNEGYFSSKFKKEYGVSFVEYLTNIRIQKAKSLMKNTTMKVYEISEAVGYNNVEHFTRVFKKNTGKSPKEYMETI